MIWMILYLVGGFLWTIFYWSKIQQLARSWAPFYEIIVLAINFIFWWMVLPTWGYARIVLGRDLLFE